MSLLTGVTRTGQQRSDGLVIRQLRFFDDHLVIHVFDAKDISGRLDGQLVRHSAGGPAEQCDCSVGYRDGDGQRGRRHICLAIASAPRQAHDSEGYPVTGLLQGVVHKLLSEGPADRSLEIRGIGQAEFAFDKEVPRLAPGRTFADAELQVGGQVR